MYFSCWKRIPCAVHRGKNEAFSEKKDAQDAARFAVVK